MTRLAAVRATGLLAEFAAAGMLTAADVQVARGLGRLTGEPDDRVLLAVALLVRGTRQGSVVLDLAEAEAVLPPESDDAPDAVAGGPVPLTWPATPDWVAACAASPLIVARPPAGAPLRMVGSRLWLDRYWRQEALVAEQLLARSADRPSDFDPPRLRADLAALFTAADELDQQRASAVAALSRVSVIGGGPGTGKTTTIARLLAVLHRQRPQWRMALAAPTGKAAARLGEAVHAAGAPLTDDDRAFLASLSTATLHRLLGRRPGVRSRFRHDRDNRLPFDVVVVDECSMVSLTLMARLLEALAPATRLVLVGDPDQLASVEAGAVLGDLVDQADVGPVRPAFAAELAAVVDDAPAGTRADGPGAALRESVTLLRTVHRFDAGGSIAELARLVRAGEADAALEVLAAEPPGLAFRPTVDDEPITGAALAALRVAAEHEMAVIGAARAGDEVAALDALDRHRLLCAHRAGPRGVRHWSDTIERWLAATDTALLPRLDGRYAGQPLLVTANDYENGLYNGDTGVVIERGGELVAAFRRAGAAVLVPLVRLGEVRPLHAMTVHRAQGSQFHDVTVLLPPADSPLATRQTLYTAITRAAATVTVVGSPEAVLAAVARPAARATGLRDRLTGALA